jgi:hypothetical protein
VGRRIREVLLPNSLIEDLNEMSQHAQFPTALSAGLRQPLQESDIPFGSYSPSIVPPDLHGHRAATAKLYVAYRTRSGVGMLYSLSIPRRCSPVE